jgi:hypothetical protein
VSYEGADRHRLETWAAMAGLAVGGVMAVFGLPPVDLHGVLHHFGIMDPLCGGTRALYFSMRGEWSLAWKYNPLSPLLVAGAVAALIRHLVGVVRGRWVTIRITWNRWLIGALAGVFLLLEINQQMHAALLSATGPAGHRLPLGILVQPLVLGGAVALNLVWRRRLTKGGPDQPG